MDWSSSLNQKWRLGSNDNWRHQHGPVISVSFTDQKMIFNDFGKNKNYFLVQSEMPRGVPGVSISLI